MFKIFWNAVCQVPLEVVPNIFIRIKLWCISGKRVRLDAMMLLQKLLNSIGFNVDFTSIPQQEYGTPDSVQHMLEKAHNFISMNVFIRMKANKESKASSLRRNADRRNSRQFIRMHRHRKSWGFSSWCPRSSNIWGKQKTAFIEENQVRPELSGFFLYGAKHGPSNPEFVVLPFLVLFLQVSGNSNSTRALNARRDSHDNGFQKDAQFPLRYALTSKAPLDNLRLMIPFANVAIIFFFDLGLFWGSGQESVLTTSPSFLFLCRCAAIVQPSLMSNPAILRLSDSLNHFARVQWRVVFAILTAYLFVLVSCIKNSLLVKRCTHSLCETQ